jgi:hypothetical protein
MLIYNDYAFTGDFNSVRISIPDLETPDITRTLFGIYTIPAALYPDNDLPLHVPDGQSDLSAVLV